MGLISDIREKHAMKKGIEHLLDEAKMSQRYFVMTTLSAAIATLGILLNSSSIIIGAMVLAPLLLPILSLSIGIVSHNFKLISYSLKTTFGGLAMALLISSLISYGFAPANLDQSVYELFDASYIHFLVALFSGVAAVYTWFDESKSDVLPGVAIAVALMPPLSFMGVMIGNADWANTISAFWLINLNILGISAGGIATFVGLGLNKVKYKDELIENTSSEAGS